LRSNASVAWDSSLSSDLALSRCAHSRRNYPRNASRARWAPGSSTPFERQERLDAGFGEVQR